MSVSVVKPPSVVSRVGLGTVGEGGSSRGNLENYLSFIIGKKALRNLQPGNNSTGMLSYRS